MQSLAHQFLNFCRSKPADERYDYMDNCGCALFHCLQSLGYPLRSVGGDYWRDHESQKHPLGFDHMVIATAPWTFGALTKRLETALAEQAN